MSGISFLCEVAESSAGGKNECADCSSDEIINGNCSVSLYGIAVQLSELRIRRKE